MSKQIRVTDNTRESILSEIDTYLRTGGKILSDGKLSFTKTLDYKDRRAKLLFTPVAYAKMLSIIKVCDKEVAWHGTVRRGEDETKDEYIVDDIFVYPQEVDATNVNTDQEEYQKWIIENDMNGVFDLENLKFQGHSHVRMGTSPSGVDLAHQQKIIDQLDDDKFYIFVIWNKMNDRFISIYDFGKNCLFETKDIDVEITGLGNFVDDSLKMVKPKKTYYEKYSNYKGSTAIANTYNTYSYKKDSKNSKDKTNKSAKKKGDKTPRIGTSTNPRKNHKSK